MGHLCLAITLCIEQQDISTINVYFATMPDRVYLFFFSGLSTMPDSAKSSKSVNFTVADAEDQGIIDPMGLLIEPQQHSEVELGRHLEP